MKVGKNTVVTLTYTLKKDNAEGEVIQEVDKSRPFVHMFGAGTLLPAFENNLDGLEAGDNFAFDINAEEAYGNPNKDAIIELEKKIFEIDGVIDEKMLTVGNMITMQDQQGNPLDGKVMAIKDESVIMDFNHPLAGENLYFSGSIIDVRTPSEEELSHGHVHGHEGHNH